MSVEAARFGAAARRAAHAASLLLGWRPREFWDATPDELRTALGLDAPGDEAPATTTLLAQLMEAFPDERQ